MSDSFESQGDFTPETLSIDGDTALETTTLAVEVIETAAPAEPNGFELLGLAPELVQACADLGYVQPTQVQNRVIPKALLGEGEAARYADLMVSSQTGSGKTAAFLLPVLHTLIRLEAEAEAREQAEATRAAAEAAARGEAPPQPKRRNPTHPRHPRHPPSRG